MEVDMLDRRGLLFSIIYLIRVISKIDLLTDYKSGYYWPQYL